MARQGFAINKSARSNDAKQFDVWQLETRQEREKHTERCESRRLLTERFVVVVVTTSKQDTLVRNIPVMEDGEVIGLLGKRAR